MSNDHKIGVVLYWIGIISVIVCFTIESWVSYFGFLFIVPIFYGTHEAIHNNLFVTNENTRKSLNIFSGILGGSLQFMNFFLLKKAHFLHHKLGRGHKGYAPDILTRKAKPMDFVIYYFYLLGAPALSYQIGGFVLLFFPANKIGFDLDFELKSKQERYLFYLAQTVTALAVFALVFLGGWLKFLIYIICLNLIWSLLQNVAHYGIIGIDAKTDRIVAHTYILEKPFKILTFGSTSHLAHHLRMEIPGCLLYEKEALNRTEELIGHKINKKAGIIAFILDVFKQFKGPIHYSKLETNWIITKNEIDNKEVIIHNTNYRFDYRKGRKWLTTNPQNLKK